MRSIIKSTYDLKKYSIVYENTPLTLFFLFFNIMLYMYASVP